MAYVLADFDGMGDKMGYFEEDDVAFPAEKGCITGCMLVFD
jgi:hypothetical protein